jgi:hypothetical protein
VDDLRARQSGLQSSECSEVIEKQETREEFIKKARNAEDLSSADSSGVDRFITSGKSISEDEAKSQPSVTDSYLRLN